MKKLFSIFFTIIILTFLGQAQDSLNMKKLSVWTSPNASEYNDCWGFTDENGNEYVILGSNWGTHFINVTDPQNPIEVNSFIGFNSNVIWRDFKVSGNYAFGVADNFFNSLQIFDLSNLPNSVSIVYDDILLSESAHNIYIENERAYLASNRRNDTVFALDVISLEDPLNPFLLASFDDSYFGFCGWGCLHDIYVKNNIAYCSAGYEGLYIYDFTDLQNPVLLGSITNYSSKGYNHSSWAHEDGNILVMADEVPNSLPLKSHDISDISNPLELTTFISNVGARPHNPFFVKNDLVVSYYLDGVQIFDFTNPANPVRSAFYDTYPNNDTLTNPYPDEFNGAWGVYPFFNSKNIAVADINTGLYMVTKEKDVYTTLEELSVCDNVGTSVNVDFYVKGNFEPNNVFYLELADENGSFIDAVRIDSLNENLEGNYTFTFDPNNFTDTKFRLRISSTSPEIAQSSWLALTYNETPEKPLIISNDGVLTSSVVAENYQWYKNGTPIPGANKQSYTPNSTGDNYFVEVRNGLCKNQSDEVISSIPFKLEELNTYLFPNPTNNKVTFIHNPNGKRLEINVMDAKGTLVKSFHTNEKYIELALRKGMYFVKMNSKDLQKVVKLIVN